MKNKITPFQYAVFLYEITSKAKRPAIKNIIKSFVGILAKNNDLAKIDDIIREFEAYEKKQRGIKEVKIISVKPLARALKNQIVGAIRGKLEVKESTDPDLLGGLVLIIGDTMIDGSLRNKLRKLNQLLSYG